MPESAPPQYVDWLSTSGIEPSGPAQKSASRDSFLSTYRNQGERREAGGERGEFVAAAIAEQKRPSSKRAVSSSLSCFRPFSVQRESFSVGPPSLSVPPSPPPVKVNTIVTTFLFIFFQSSCKVTLSKPREPKERYFRGTLLSTDPTDGNVGFQEKDFLCSCASRSKTRF